MAGFNGSLWEKHDHTVHTCLVALTKSNALSYELLSYSPYSPDVFCSNFFREQMSRRVNILFERGQYCEEKFDKIYWEQLFFCQKVTDLLYPLCILIQMVCNCGMSLHYSQTSFTYSSVFLTICFRTIILKFVNHKCLNQFIFSLFIQRVLSDKLVCVFLHTLFCSIYVTICNFMKFSSK